MTTTFPIALAGAALALVATAVPVGTGVGDPLPTPELTEFRQTTAETFDEYRGRAVLIEFFEHW